MNIISVLYLSSSRTLFRRLQYMLWIGDYWFHVADYKLRMVVDREVAGPHDMPDAGSMILCS
jgi:hypothetical protein